MKTINFNDGSIGRIYEKGDLVEIIKDQPISGTAGEWGKVYRTDGDGLIARLDIQLAGYSRDENAFFQAATSVPSWDVKPYNRKGVQ